MEVCGGVCVCVEVCVCVCVCVYVCIYNMYLYTYMDVYADYLLRPRLDPKQVLKATMRQNLAATAAPLLQQLSPILRCAANAPKHTVAVHTHDPMMAAWSPSP